MAAVCRIAQPPLIRDIHGRRCLSTRPGRGIDDVDDCYIPHGPKDTLLMLGYTIKENEMESHIQSLKEALKLKMMTLEYYTEDMAQSYTDLAMAQHQSVQFINEARENYLKAFEIWSKIRGPESREVANALCLIGVVLRDIGDVDAAKSAFEDSLKIDKKLNSVESQLSSVFAINNLAAIEHIKQNFDDAVSLYEDALRIMLTATGGDPNHRMIALLYYNLACCHRALVDHHAAETALNRARSIIAQIGDHNHLAGRIEQLLKEVAMVQH
ncbi:hypothetical protein X943_000335 [Babesia divergens]|uniref:Uncharacterized protein n=1 Tax=Babesia divergens TaxID=32595 RepID=A0AAD9GCT6_BABDI|nr:hypothetical protein X943_000335 [Babesia divergens]